MSDLLNYLKENLFDTQLKYLIKKLRDKKVIIYGAGKMFKTINDNYDLSAINIVGITDQKFKIEEEGNNYLGYKIYYYTNFINEDFDVILVASQFYKPILRLYSNSGKKITPLCKQTFVNKIREQLQAKLRKTDKNNKLVLIKTNGKKVYNPKIKNLKIEFQGNNNYIEIREPFSIDKRCNIILGNKNKLIFGKFNEISIFNLELGNNNILKIGDNNWLCNVVMWNRLLKNTQIEIGNDCKFAYNVEFKATDAHIVYDINTLQHLNPPKDIVVGNHVWVGRGCFIMKGAKIPNNCIVGANSLVNKEFFEENCLIAGTPAKIIKKGVNWSRVNP